MKTLLEYLEAQKTEYKFRLKFAVEVTSDMQDKLEAALGKFEVKKVGNPKKTIISGRQLDFPNEGPGETYIVDLVCEYPATRETIRDTVAQALRISPSKIVVRTDAEPLEQDRAVESEPSGEALLTKEYEKTKTPDVHSNKALKKAHGEHKSKEFEYAAKSDTKANPGPEFESPSSASPVGSTKVKKPKVTSAAR